MKFIDVHKTLHSCKRAKMSFGVLFFLLDRCDDKGIFQGSRDDVATGLDVEPGSIKNISHSLRELKEIGYVDVQYIKNGELCERPAKGSELYIKLSKPLIKLFLN